MTETIAKLEESFTSWKLEDEKFQNGNNAAGTRARKVLQEISKMVKERRQEISEEKISRKESKK